MNEFQTVVNIISSLVSSISLPLLGVFLFYDSKKRSEAAKAKQSEAEAQKMEEEYLSIRAGEWRKLYEEEREVEKELNAKIDQLYKEKEDDRQRIRDLQEKNTALTLENQSLKFKKCEVRGCKERQPPSDY